MSDGIQNNLLAKMSVVNDHLIKQTTILQEWMGVWLSDDDDFGRPEVRLLEAHKRGLETYQEVLNSISLQTKYMQFDLEATRRENAQLLKLLTEIGDKYSTDGDAL